MTPDNNAIPHHSIFCITIAQDVSTSTLHISPVHSHRSGIIHNTTPNSSHYESHNPKAWYDPYTTYTISSTLSFANLFPSAQQSFSTVSTLNTDHAARSWEKTPTREPRGGRGGVVTLRTSTVSSESTLTRTFFPSLSFAITSIITILTHKPILNKWSDDRRTDFQPSEVLMQTGKRIGGIW